MLKYRQGCIWLNLIKKDFKCFLNSYLPLCLCRLPDGDILVQKRYDTCNPILYELNYLRPFLGSPVLFYLWFCRPTFILAQEFILISKDLSSPLHSRGFIFTVTQKKQAGKGFFWTSLPACGNWLIYSLFSSCILFVAADYYTCQSK